MNRDSAIGVAIEGGFAIWARASRSLPNAPSAGGSGSAPAARGGERLTLALAVPDVLLRAERIPSSDPDEIAAIAANRMEAESPLEPDEMVFSCETLEVREDGALVLCAAAPVSACTALLAAATGSGDPSGASRVARVDAAAAGFARSLAACGALAPAGRQPVLAAAGCGDSAVILVFDGGRLVLARAAGAPAAFARSLSLALLQTEMACSREVASAPLLFVSGSSADPAWPDAARAAAAATGRECREVAADSVPPLAFGAAMRTLESAAGRKPLDLFPEAWRTKLADRRYRRNFAAGAGAALVAWLALVGVLWGGPAVLGAREAALRREADALSPSEGAVRQIRERIRLIDRYSDRSHSPLEILREISLALPDGVTLKQMSYEAARHEATVEGESRGSSPAYDFSNRLKSSPLLARNDIVSGPTENRNTGKTNFRIRLSFSAADGEGGAQ